jgi:hypothetical protein
MGFRQLEIKHLSERNKIRMEKEHSRGMERPIRRLVQTSGIADTR